MYPNDMEKCLLMRAPQSKLSQLVLLLAFVCVMNVVQGLILSAALPAGKHNYGHLNLKDLAENLDFINIMTYDY